MTIFLSAKWQLPLKDPVLIFSLVLFIILLAPILLRKLRIPSIIGLIIAGMVIGENGFGIIQKSSIDLFGKAGLLYIMFLAGLELDMTEFKKNRNKSIGFGIFTFAIPLFVGFALCRYVMDFSFMASLLVSSMFATHTLVAYPLASRLGITRNEAVTVTVGGTIITDTAVLIILAVITGAASGELNQGFWLRLGLSITLFAVAVMWGFPLIGRWFFKKIKDDKTSHFIFVLAMVFLAGFLAELAGIEAIIGAFLAGLALNQLIPHSSSLMNRIEFVGNALFIPFFLITVGMLVDLRVLLKGPEALKIAAALTLMALSTKFLAAFLAQKFFGFSATQRNVIFGLSSAHAAATIAVILIGYNMNIVDENVLNGTVILILVTCMVGSFVTANAGRKLAIQAADMNHKAPDSVEDRFLVPILKEEEMEELVDFALMIHDKQHTTPVYPLAVVQDDAAAKEQIVRSNRLLEKVVAHAAATDAKVQVVTRIDLNLSDGIARAVKELMISDLVLPWPEKPTTTERLFGTLFGTNIDNILNGVRETIYICRFVQPMNIVKKIVVAVPKNAEFEKGFVHWVQKLNYLAKQAGARLVVYGTARSFKAVKAVLESMKGITDVQHREFSGIEDLLLIAREAREDDMLVVLTSRKGSISYESSMDNVVGKISKHFSRNNAVLIYPEQLEGNIHEPGIRAEDITLAPIEEQLKNLNKIRKVVQRFFGGKGK
ncbi:cation:proton antiporter [Parasegetibacter sp. NRK P23]|uniref:cation:proton antiporter n=1 Tax=Parasegetibacter sp. NRK P23 TaxID=2942999 RepID=UPI002044BCD8|nr:cation:proton antiporter [Parasegetibacter sp. NRK P23]MCM5527018.1 cation:proton antiporter [Parasegetibacter sp. NRK P23]